MICYNQVEIDIKSTKQYFLKKKDRNNGGKTRSENKNTIKWGKSLAIILCIVVGVLANETITLQKT